MAELQRRIKKVQYGRDYYISPFYRKPALYLASEQTLNVIDSTIHNISLSLPLGENIHLAVTTTQYTHLSIY